MLDFSNFSSLVEWVLNHGYILFFIIAFFEGPLITAAAGVAAGLGHFNIFVIIGLSLLADFSADLTYFYIGHRSKDILHSKAGRFVGITPERVEKLRKLIHGHLKKTIAVVKLSPIISVPGIMIIGATRASVKTFITMSISLTLPSAILFALIGFYSGKAYDKLNQTITQSQYLIFGVMIAVLLAYYGYKKLSVFISNRLEKIKLL